MLFPIAGKVGQDPRVVVTGAGIVSPHGIGWAANEQAFRAGRSSFAPVQLFDTSRQRTKLAAQAPLNGELPPTRLPSKAAHRSDRAARLLLWAAHEAWEQAGWESGGNIPVVLGTTSGGMNLGEAFVKEALSSASGRRRQATRVVHYHAQTQGLGLCEAFGFEGPLTIIANACASGANAIAHAVRLLRRGGADRVFTGGYDALCQLTFAGFDSLQALSRTRCRPFEADRDGLLLGEGAAMLALETLESARRRGAFILGEIAGTGCATDIHHLTQPHPQGNAALAAMQAACAEARVAPEEIDYINAHGTATPQNDATEAEAINRWAGSRVSTLAVSSTKAGIGHLLGAAGAVEAVICLMALRGQWLPPQECFGAADPVCRFPIVSQPRDGLINAALSNSFGFGGANACLVLRRWR